MYRPVTLIIGLGQTVGDAVARRFLDAGHDVLAVDPNQHLLDELKKTVGDKIAYHHGAIHTKLGLRNAMAAALGAIGGIVLGIIMMFQPWVFVLFRYGFYLLLFSTLAFIVWSHVTAAPPIDEFATDMAAD